MMFHDRTTDVEAHRWDGTARCLTKLRRWEAGIADVPPPPNRLSAQPERDRARINQHVVLEPGDWLVKTLDGTFFAAQHDWFEDVYTPTKEV